MKSTRIIGTVLCTLAIALIGGCNNCDSTASAYNGTTAGNQPATSPFDQPFYVNVAPGDRGDR